MNFTQEKNDNEQGDAWMVSRPAATARQSRGARHRRRRVVIASAAAIGSAAAVSAGAGTALAAAQPDASPCSVSSTLVPSCGAWAGVSPGMVKDRQQGLLDFERQTGAAADIYHAYHQSGQLFPTAQEVAIARQPGNHRLLLINYKPEGGHTWAEVAAGANDAELDREAAYIKSHFTEKFFLAIHHEPEDEVRPAAGSGYTATDYRNMYRHVAQRLKAHGADNAVFVMNYMGAQTYGVQEWFPDLYPGDDVVDWIAGDPYACIVGKPCNDFAWVMNKRFSERTPWPGFYKWATQSHPGKPIMLAEWGAFENGDASRQADYLGTAAAQLKQFPQLKALVYWNSVGPRGDVRVTTTPAATAAMKRFLASSVFAQDVP